MNLTITEASIDQKPILANLLELYTYEFSDFADFDIGENGLYGYKHLSLYWSEPNRHPFLILLDNKLAGFALVTKGSPITEDPEVWDMTEFFILKKYRRSGIGTRAALKLWKMLNGPWQIRVLSNNKTACAFWRKVTSEMALIPIHESSKTIKGKDWVIYTFKS